MGRVIFVAKLLKKPVRNKVTTTGNQVLINEFNAIVGAANVKRLVLFDSINGETALKDRSPNKQNATLSLSAGALDPIIAGKARILNFNAAGDFWEFADADDLSFGNSTADSAFSIVACINPNTMVTSGPVVCAKYDLTTGTTKTEYIFQFVSSKLYLYMNDNSTTGRIGRLYNTALTADIGSYHTYISTYSGNSNASGINIYRDGTAIDDADYNTGTYVAMENLGAKVGNYYLSAAAAKTGVANAKYAFLAIVAGELTQPQVTSIDSLLRKQIGAI